MAIKVPGKRDRHGRLKGASRTAVATLSLTAMVDMFTVIVVFLLMNYQSTGEIIPMKDNVDLPAASAVEDLEPSHVVVLSEVDGVEVNGKKVETYKDVVNAKDWVLPKLKKLLEKEILLKKEEKKNKLANQIKEVVQDAQNPNQKPAYKPVKVTVQADKKVDILSLKKVMYMITEAGGEAINFAVMRLPSKKVKEVKN